MLYLLRHGQTAHNATRRLLGRLDIPLDELGHRQARALGQVPSVAAATLVTASPLTRAQETAAALGPPVTTDERWAEMDYGVYDGLPIDEVPAPVWDRWLSDPAWRPEGGESHDDLMARVTAACEALWPRAIEEDVVVVSHVSPIKAAVAWCLDVGIEVSWRMRLDTASICRMAAGRRDRPSLLSFNETDHRPSV